MVRVLQIRTISCPSLELCGNSASRDSSASSESKTEQPSKKEAARAADHSANTCRKGFAAAQP